MHLRQAIQWGKKLLNLLSPGQFIIFKLFHSYQVRGKQDLMNNYVYKLNRSANNQIVQIMAIFVIVQLHVQLHCIAHDHFLSWGTLCYKMLIKINRWVETDEIRILGDIMNTIFIGSGGKLARNLLSSELRLYRSWHMYQTIIHSIIQLKCPITTMNNSS